MPEVDTAGGVAAEAETKRDGATPVQSEPGATPAAPGPAATVVEERPAAVAVTPAESVPSAQEIPQRHDVAMEPEVAPVPGSEPDPIIVGFLCEWAANMNKVLDDNGVVSGMPNVRMIKIPCSGMTKPAWLEMALSRGAEGVFVCGCPIVDCHFREGNVLIRDRMLSRRAPKPKRLDLQRTRGYWYEALETDKLLDDLRQFTSDLKSLKETSG